VSPALERLLESGEFDWHDRRHRETYLREFVRGAFSPVKCDPRVAVGR
jgi:hypothetical protein